MADQARQGTLSKFLNLPRKSPPGSDDSSSSSASEESTRGSSSWTRVRSRDQFGDQLPEVYGIEADLSDYWQEHVHQQPLTDNQLPYLFDP